jgi:hypothetical protein
VIWPLCMAYAAFLLADTKSFSSLSVMITPHFSGRCLDFAWELCSLTEHTVDTAKMSSGGRLQECRGEAVSLGETPQTENLLHNQLGPPHWSRCEM